MGHRRRVHRSLQNFDESNTLKPILNSPRSLEACRRQGLKPEEFVYRHPESFEEPGASAEIVQLRWRHYEKKRREKLHWAIEVSAFSLTSASRARAANFPMPHILMSDMYCPQHHEPEFPRRAHHRKDSSS